MISCLMVGSGSILWHNGIKKAALYGLALWLVFFCTLFAEEGALSGVLSFASAEEQTVHEASSGSAEGTAERNLTLMIYLCGSNLESEYGSATQDLAEIGRACAGNAEVTVLAMIGGSSSWTGGICGPEEIRILEIGRRGTRQIFTDDSGMNMGDAETLSFLLHYGVKNRPAARYALILWDHGGGPMEGVCFDERYRMDALSLKEMEKALAESPFSVTHPIAWIGFDACLMASLETARCCENYAEYLIASQETEPAAGWDYSFLEEIGSEDSAEDMGRRILEAYMRDKKETDLLTLSLIRTRGIAGVERNADWFFGKISGEITEADFPELSRCRLNTKSFGRAATGSDYDLVDLYHLTELHIEKAPEEAKWLQKALENAVVACVGNQENAHGLSIFYPYYNKQAFLAKWQETYRGFDFLAGYRSFLNRYAVMWTGESAVSFAGLRGEAFPLTAQGTQRIELTLTDEQREHFAEASCAILADYGSEQLFHQIYTIGEVTLEGNTLKAEYAFEALYAVDENGIVETAAIPFFIRDGYYLISAFLMESSALDDGFENGVSVLLRCRKQEATGELEIVDIIPNSDDGQLNLGRQSIDLNTGKWEYLYLNGYKAREMTRDGENSLLPFDQWAVGPDAYRFNVNRIDAEGNQIERVQSALQSYKDSPVGRTHQENEADLTRPWKLQFLPLRYTGQDVAAQFTVRDTQGSEWGSELIPLSPPGLRDAARTDLRDTELPGCTLHGIEVRAIQTETFTGISLRISLENTHEDGSLLQLWLLDPMIDGQACPGLIYSSSRFAGPGEHCILDVQIPVEEMYFSENAVLREISFQPMISFLDELTNHCADQICLSTELDISGLRHPTWDGSSLAACDVEQITFELIHLEETEEGTLQGCMRLMNRSGLSKYCFFLNGDNDDSFPGGLGFGVNDRMTEEGVRMNHFVFLLPGTEAYVPFEFVPGEGRRLQASGEESEPWERKISQIILCGFQAAFVENTENCLDFPEEWTDSRNIYFALKRPFFLKHPFWEVYTPSPTEGAEATDEGGMEP